MVDLQYNILGFGKYKGKNLSDVEDLQYLTWLLQQTFITEYLRSKVRSRVVQLNLLKNI